MEKQQLEQYRALQNEQKMLSEKIVEIERQLSQHTVTDRVMGSEDDHPYAYHSITLQGVPRTAETEEIRRQLFSIKVLRRERMCKAMRVLAEIERFISGIDDSLMRQIFELRCVDGLSWAQIAGRVGGGNTEAGVRMIYTRYLKKSNIK